MISVKADVDTFPSISRHHIPPSNAIRGKESPKEEGLALMYFSLGICFDFTTTKERVDEVETTTEVNCMSKPVPRKRST